MTVTWDLLYTNVHLATMASASGASADDGYGSIRDAAIAVESATPGRA